MHSKKNGFLRTVRITIDVFNVIFGIAVVGLAVYTFLNIKERMSMFPYIFYMGAFVNFITGIKHLISERIIYGIFVWIFTAILVMAGMFTGTVIAGM